MEAVIHLTAVQVHLRGQAAVQAPLRVQEAAQAPAVVLDQVAVPGVVQAAVPALRQVQVRAVVREVAQVPEVAPVHHRAAAVPGAVPAEAEVQVRVVDQAVGQVLAVPHLPDQVLHPALHRDHRVHFQAVLLLNQAALNRTVQVPEVAVFRPEMVFSVCQVVN